MQEFKNLLADMLECFGNTIGALAYFICNKVKVLLAHVIAVENIILKI